MKTDREVLDEILEAVAMSPVAAFASLKKGELTSGFLPHSLQLRCPACGMVVGCELQYEGWQALVSQNRFEHASGCPRAKPVSQPPRWFAK